MFSEKPSNRIELIRQVISIALNSTYQNEAIDEQKLMNLLGDLVREKLLSAEDSFKLRESLLQTRRLDSYIDSRIDSHLKKQASN
ncbi:MAG: hypothetical protein ACO3LE_01350 [Bdellovibrionota bacterium]